jgi:hypothetical protein
MEVKNLKRGDVVLAVRRLDVKASNVRKGTIGVVFEEANFYKDGAGPTVRWTNMGVCNIYSGDVINLESSEIGVYLTDKETGEIYGIL